LSTQSLTNQPLHISTPNVHQTSGRINICITNLRKHEIMDPTFELDIAIDDFEAKREIIRGCLGEIVVEVGNRLRVAGLSCPIFLTVPNSGDAIAMMATPLDPSDEDWSHVGEIVRTTVSERLNGLKLRNRDMICGAANAAIGSAELTAD
jgi:hypothetical protein